MAGPDIVLFVVGFVLFAGAGYALVAQGGISGGGPTTIYTVDFPVNKGVDAGKPQAVGDFASAAATFSVSQANVAKATIAIVCSDTVPGNTFRFEVKVEAPNGIVVDPKGGVCGQNVQIEVPVSAAPPGTSVQGSDAASAQANIPAAENATKAKGDWKITVNGARTGGLPGLPAGNPGGSIALSLDVWAPKLTPVVK